MDHPSAGTDISLRKSKNSCEVYVRHSAECKHKKKGRFFPGCDCPKWLYIYINGEKDERSAKTRAWKEAEHQRDEILDGIDPEKQKAREIIAAHERKQIRIEDAIRLHLADMKAAGRSENTIKRRRFLLGDPGYVPSGLGRSKHYGGGYLLSWLKTFNDSKAEFERIVHLRQLDSEILMHWRADWKFNDLSAYTNWTDVIIFLNFCVRQGWLPDNPAHKLSKMQVAKGNRTAIFTDAQYQQVLDATYAYDPPTMSAETRRVIGCRVRTFIEAMRWSGMAIQDCINLTPDKIDADGVLRYYRTKTGILSIVPLPRHVLALLKDLPRESDSVDGFYFRTQGVIDTVIRRWEDRLEEVFRTAGIFWVKTDIRERKPHSHMFRDTFAVHYINKDVPLSDVAKMLGHANSKITEKCYLPWVMSRQDALVRRVRDVQEGERAGVVNIASKRKIHAAYASKI